ncbi:uncharacterized protein LOC131950354 [Physella acuta]|uniref:uncharacterized protein LOC131950354 n=1 Tax=Physella acuta TaxID=109671 RepID=UPI0027DE70E4|nr:uncharacterized protein LOC131950354 [Physella acuta]
MSEEVTTAAQVSASVNISPIVLDFFLTFNMLVCGNIIALLGISGNIINIIVFNKQGYEDSVNITLTALAVISQKKETKNTYLSNKEKKVVLMLTVVSVIFIVCLIPQSAILTAVSQVPGLAVRGVYFDVALLCYSISYLMEAVCSSVNILVYYKMSSRYRKSLQSIWFKSDAS